MAILRFVIWTVSCVAIGVAMGTVEFGGSTAWERMQKGWKQQAPQVERVKHGAEGLVDEMKKKVSSVEVPKEPSEKHSATEKKAIDQIIAKH